MPKTNLDINAEEKTRAVTAKILAEYLFSISDMCRFNEWHTSGLHIMIAAEELEKMLAREETAQGLTGIRMKQGNNNEKRRKA